MADLALADGTLMDQNNLSTQEQAARNRCVNAILDLEFPNRHVSESLADLAKTMPTIKLPPQPVVAQLNERRLILNGLTLTDLQALLSQLREAHARQEEASRFYNQRSAFADFRYWLSMDFWALDEAVPLLLGRNPVVVNRATVAQYLGKPKGFLAGAAKPPTKFTNVFQALQLQAERSNAMTASSKLRPVDVVRWGATVLGSALPAPFAQLLEGQEPKAPAAPSVTGTVSRTEPLPLTDPVPVSIQETERTAAAQRDAPPQASHEGQPLIVTRAALLALKPIWEDVENDLHHSARNGLALAAKAEGRNRWNRQAAIEWATSRGKIKPAAAQLAHAQLPRAFFGE